MITLTATERRALRARAHALHPVVMIGHSGLTPAVLHEIDVNLVAHELIKVRALSDERKAREAWLAEICAALDAAAVQHLGKLLILYRPRPAQEEAAKPRQTRRREGARPGAVAKTSARKPTAPRTGKKHLVPSSEREVSVAARRRRGQSVDGLASEAATGNRRRLRGRD